MVQVISDRVKMMVMSVDNSLRMRGLMVSGPEALYGLSAGRSLVIPGVVMDISRATGWVDVVSLLEVISRAVMLSVNTN